MSSMSWPEVCGHCRAYCPSKETPLTGYCNIRKSEADYISRGCPFGTFREDLIELDAIELHTLLQKTGPMFWGGMTIRVGKPYRANMDLMQQDSFHMQTDLGNNIHVLHANHSHRHADYLILVHTKTGRSVVIEFPEENKEEDDVQSE